MNSPASITDINAERALLGGLLVDPHGLHGIADTLAPDDFFVERHNWIYAAMLELRQEYETADIVGLSAKLVESGHGEKETGGPAYLTGLIAESPPTCNVSHLSAIVSRLAVLRRVISAAGEIAREAYKPDAVPELVFDRARSLLEAVVPSALDKGTLVWRASLEDWLGGQSLRGQEAADHGTRMAFPWRAISSRVPWLRPGMMVAVAADSGIGKTAFLECCAEHWAKQGRKVAFFHFELSYQVMLDRRMARQAGVPVCELEDGLLDERTSDALERLASWHGGITYAHCPGWSMQRVAATARKLAAQGLADVVMVDYLQKARLEHGDGLTPAQMRGQQVEALKVLAEQLAVPVLLASQLNRSAFGQARKSRHSIRDTGELDEKANVVILLDRQVLEDDLYDESIMPAKMIAEAGQLSPVMRVFIDKNTLGETGDGKLRFDGSRFRLLDIAS
jgi:replicative DNA helicase